jgi:hypothetical protein
MAQVDVVAWIIGCKRAALWWRKRRQQRGLPVARGQPGNGASGRLWCGLLVARGQHCGVARGLEEGVNNVVYWLPQEGSPVVAQLEEGADVQRGLLTTRGHTDDGASGHQLHK